MSQENKPTSAVKTPLHQLKDALIAAKGSMSAVAAKMVTPDKLIKIGIAAAQRNPTLLKCSTASIVRAIIQGAELGLTPGSALNSAYLVPFKNKTSGGGEVWEAQLVVSAQGLSELVYRSGLVSFISAEVVYEGDDFHYELGLEPKLLHVPMDETIDANKITHAYMVVGLKDGSRVFRVMTRKAIDRIRDRSPQGGEKGPWKDHYAEMARKTVLKNGFKYVPKSIEVAKAISLDNAQETGDFSSLDFETPDALPEPQASVPGTSAAVASKVLIETGDEHNPFMDDSQQVEG